MNLLKLPIQWPFCSVYWTLADDREKGLLIPYMETIVILCSLPHLRCFWISRFQIGIRLLYQYLNYSCPSTCSSYSIRTNGTNCSRSGRGCCCVCCLIRSSLTNIQHKNPLWSTAKLSILKILWYVLENFFQIIV